MVYSKQLFRTVLLLLLSMLPLELCAQATLDELLDGYVSTSVSGESVTPYITKINQIYKNYRKDQQGSLRSKIYDRVVGDTIMEQNKLKGKFALIDLYALLADSDDSKLDYLYFKKGEICGLHTGDTIMLKECITSLKLSDHSKSTSVKGYVNTLQGYLEEIRNYLPVSQRIDGVWVSTITYEIVFTDIYETPAFVLNISKNGIKFENVGYATKFADISFWTDKARNDENTYAQKIIDIGKDKLYMLWSNEKLKIPNQAVALSLGQVAGDITFESTREVTSDIIGNIGGDIVGGIAGNVISSAVMDLFAPSKKMYVLEMELEKINNYELVGHFCNQVIKIDGNGKPDITKEEKDILFIKYDIESEVFFGSYRSNAKKYVPGYEISNAFPLSFSKKFIELADRYQKGFDTHMMMSMEKFQSYLCTHQIQKLLYYNDQKMIQEGCKMSNKYHQFAKTAYLGAETNPYKQKNSYNSETTEGVYVFDVEKGDPAYIFGIKKGDVILDVDGYEMNSHEQLTNYIRTLKAFDWITLHVKRKKKELDFMVELSYKYSGKGEVQYDDGTYEGELINGVRNGWGKYKWKDGDIYEGEWKDGLFWGKGTFRFGEGYVYEGEFVNGKLHGDGVICRAGGSKHKGTFKNNKRNGFFIEEDKDGNRFEGNYVDGKRHGRFVEKDRNGNITAQGNYIHGKRKED